MVRVGLILIVGVLGALGGTVPLWGAEPEGLLAAADATMPGEAFRFSSYISKTFVSLLVIFGGLCLFLYFVKKGGFKRVGLFGESKILSIVDRTYVDRKNQIVALQVAGQTYLIALSDNQPVLLDTLDSSEISRFHQPDAPHSHSPQDTGPFSAWFKKMVGPHETKN